ncbi:hypothetical protein LC087_12755 [Bacillus carboniphilus]|uniref:Uncharacterized protein n=1 Tax=Bacillus carboniphilus TaxID=86663 RepID=A0ABY9JSD9_9BACI|nr:hypothetical protein [Bacillus carboniphilus]WLR41729.1 hypothetical protein LC087_12755 [Bacillus carboniphilus]
METIYRTYDDTEVVELAVNVQCPYCGLKWQETGKSDCGETYTLDCGGMWEDGCGKQFEMYFDVD